MGVDLTLLPFDTSPDSWVQFSHQMVDIGKDYKMFDEMERLSKDNLVPEKFSTFRANLETVFRNETFFDDAQQFTDEKGKFVVDSGTGYGDTNETPYGLPLRWLTAKEILRLVKKYKVDSPNTRCAVGFLTACEPDRRIALYFH